MGKIILVNSHRRSGTHLLIDSLRLNCPEAVFPTHIHLPGDFNIGTLYGQSEKAYRVFKRFIEAIPVLIIKSHLLPEELNLSDPQNKYEELIVHIYQSAINLNVYRSGEDVLKSLYHFLDNGGDFLQFLQSRNDHFVYSRPAADIDENRVRY